MTDDDGREWFVHKDEHEQWVLTEAPVGTEDEILIKELPLEYQGTGQQWRGGGYEFWINPNRGFATTVPLKDHIRAGEVLPMTNSPLGCLITTEIGIRNFAWVHQNRYLMQYCDMIRSLLLTWRIDENLTRVEKAMLSMWSHAPDRQLPPEQSDS